MTQTLLEQGIGAALNGRRDEARHLLAQVVETDERNEQAWLWLAGLVTEPEEMRTCLENVLHLNPENAKAHAGLSWVEQRYGPRPADIAYAPAATSAPPAAAPASQTSATSADRPAEQVKQPVANTAPVQASGAAGAATPLAATAASDPVTTSVVTEPPPTYPCVYCGALATMEQRSCPKCHNSLMIRAAPLARRSVPLTILGILWMISGVLQLLGGIASTVMSLIAFSAIQSQFEKAHLPKPSFPPQLFVPLAAGIIAGVFVIALARGLLKRERWAYIVVLVLTGLGLLGAVAMIVLGTAIAPALMQALSSPALSARDASAARVGAGMVMTIMFVSAGIQLLYVLLVGLSYRDFFGPMVRFQPEPEGGSDMDSYNSGVAYKRRGMWYMAAQEWEIAVKKTPRDPGYLHALGLAYVQLKQFERARAVLDQALAIAPDDAQIQESRAVVDRLDKPGKKR